MDATVNTWNNLTILYFANGSIISIVLVFYYNVINSVISLNFNNSVPAFSEANNVYPIRNTQKQIPRRSYEYIILTYRYQVAILGKEIILNTGKYYNTLIVELFENIDNGFVIRVRVRVRVRVKMIYFD